MKLRFQWPVSITSRESAIENIDWPKRLVDALESFWKNGERLSLLEQKHLLLLQDMNNLGNQVEQGFAQLVLAAKRKKRLVPTEIQKIKEHIFNDGEPVEFPTKTRKLNRR